MVVVAQRTNFERVIDKITLDLYIIIVNLAHIIKSLFSKLKCASNSQTSILLKTNHKFILYLYYNGKQIPIERPETSNESS